jgi:hypothetical protein
VGFTACGERDEESAPIPEGPFEWGVSAVADKDEIQVGEDLSVQVTVEHPPGAEFVIPTGADLAPFELIERVDEPSSSLVETVVTLRMGAYRLPGEIEVPPIKVEYRDESGEMASVETEPIPIHLVTSLTPDVTDINDIKGPIEELPIPANWNWLWWLLGILLGLLLRYLYYKYLHKEKKAAVESVPAPPPIPPEIEAERALRKLADDRLLEQGRALEFYTILAEIMKRYAGRLFMVPYLERTTTEILADLKMTRLQFEKRERLKGILVAADLVKFARIHLPEEESEGMLPESFRFVEETKPRPVVEPETKDSEGVEVGV